MKRVFALILVFMLALSLMAGCGQGGNTNAPGTSGDTTQPGTTGQDKTGAGSEKVQLTYYCWNEGAYQQEIVDAFNAASSDIQVNLTVLPDDDYDDKLITMLSGGADLDLYTMRSVQLLGRLANNGNLLDLTQLIQDTGFDTEVYGPGLLKTQVNGKYYALPYRNQAYALFYNKKIFDKKNMEYPDDLTWDEYAELALSLCEGSGADRIYGGFVPDWLYAPFITQQRGSSIADEDLGPTQEWLEFLNRLYNIDNSHMSYAQIKSTGTDCTQFFLNGKCAMLLNGDWLVGDILSNLKDDPSIGENFELGIAYLPQLDDSTEKLSIGGVSTFIGINSKSQKANAAFEFASYLSGPEGAERVAPSGMIPSYIDDKIISIYNNAINNDIFITWLAIYHRRCRA
jgi:ABC-type glycerol-3-phosphate transport system substrate-binding protein